MAWWWVKVQSHQQHARTRVTPMSECEGECDVIKLGLCRSFRVTEVRCEVDAT